MEQGQTKQKLSVYIHIPFCVQKCLYCDFLSWPADDGEKERYTEALCRELQTTLIPEKYEVQTVFIGGGTPTALLPEQLLRIGAAIQEKCGMPAVEYTMEANPGTITAQHVQAMRETGVNRVSLGLQSAEASELKQLGRIHTWQQFSDSFWLLREAGFSNINVDLMSAIPGQTLSSWQETLKKVIEVNPEHISAYSLIVEEGTPFFKQQQAGTLSLPDEDTERAMYEMTGELLERSGYNRYEISNYAKKGMECRHNLTYWTMDEYLGFGLGASSYFGGYRFKNTDCLSEYMQQYSSGSVPKKGVQDLLSVKKEVHRVTQQEAVEEFMFLGLRKCEGIFLSDFFRRFQVPFEQVYGDVARSLFEKKLLAEDRKRGRIYLTKRGIDVSNTVLAQFLFS
ncbi:MAG: radical SAM family heme chaperone HemW [Clostridiaceae bacterium]|nr:radical SAM family heme chaperone HemW [Clostridiaceae bacterium]